MVGGTLSAQKVEFPLFFKNVLPGKTVERNFVVAAHPSGSDSLDSQLGEKEIPSLPLPGDVFYVWTIAPTQEPLWLSPREIRKLKIGEQHLEKYDVRVNWNGGTLEITWPYPIPAYIDSIYVVDGKTTYPDNLISVKVQLGTKIISDNPAFDRFFVMVWYNAIGTSVDENENTDQFRLWPNPANNEITVAHEISTISYADIVNIAGDVVKRLQLKSPLQTISVSDLPVGIFIIRIGDAKGNVVSKMFVHH